MVVFLLVVKMLAMLTTAGLALCGVSSIFQQWSDKARRRVRVWGILVPLLFAVVAECVQTYIQRCSAQASRREAAELRKQVARGPEPVWPLTVGYTVNLPIDDDVMQSFRDRLNNGVQSLLWHYEKDGRPPGIYHCCGLEVTIRSRDGEVESVRLMPGEGSLLPEADSDKPAYGAFYPYRIHLAFLKAPRAPEDVDIWGVPGVTDRAPDLAVDIPSAQPFIWYELHDQSSRIQLGYNDVSVDQTASEGNNRIISLADLSGAQLLMCFNGGFTFHAAVDQDIDRVRASASLISVDLRFGGRSLRVTADDLTRHTDRAGWVCWAYRFSTDLGTPETTQEP